MASIPTQRTLRELKALGFDAQVVERWNKFAGKRQDFAGCIDVIAWKPGVGILGIQTTSGDNHANRRAKLCAAPRLRGLIESGMRAELWSWSKKGARGKRKLWELRREELKVEDLATA